MPTPTIPLRRAVKLRARQLMLHLLSLRVTLLFVAVSMAFFGLRYLLNGTLSLTLASLASYGDTTSGFYVLDEGINVIFRMDLTGTVAALSLTWSQLRVFLLVNAVFFLLLVPLKLGAMEVYWDLTRGKKDGKVVQVFQWYLQAGRLVKAWVVEFCVQILVGVLTFVASTPALFLFYRFYSTTTSMASFDFSRRLLLWSADGLAILALLFGLWLNSLLLPVRYCLAAHPEYSLGETFRRGFRSARGIRGGFYRFRLSYIIWFFLSRLTYGAMDLYVLPYSSIGSMLYLQQAAQVRDQSPREEPMPMVSEEDREDLTAWPPAETVFPPEQDETPEAGFCPPDDLLPGEEEPVTQPEWPPENEEEPPQAEEEGEDLP